ncbi:MAG: hypothetical protein R6W48_09895 [Gaiellaceae bacterium]
MSTTTWFLAGALAAALVLAAVLWLALRRARRQAARADELVTAARRAVRAAADDEAAIQSDQLRVSISRAHADSLSAFVAEEHRLSDQRRGELSVRERELADRFAEMLAVVERRAEERLRAWEADLERAQGSLEGEIAKLEHHQRQRIATVEARIDAETSELGSAIDEQRAATARIRGELETMARDALSEALDELQTQADDRHRAIEEMTERLRQHEHSLAELVDSAEGEARARIEAGFADMERRQLERLERATAREVERLSEAGALEFENRMRAIREEAAGRLREELDRSTESFLRRADMVVSDQFQQAVDAALRRLDDRIIELARQADASRSSASS